MPELTYDIFVNFVLDNTTKMSYYTGGVVRWIRHHTMSNLAFATRKTITTYDAIEHRFTDPPPGKLYLLYGDPTVFRLSLTLASYALLRGNPIAVIDGCNRFDAHGIARFAREHSIEPNVLLNNIHISRGFTSTNLVSPTGIQHHVGRP